MCSQCAPATSVPPLKDAKGTWHLSPDQKAELFASTFESKFTLPTAQPNEYTAVVDNTASLSGFLPVRWRHGHHLLKSLQETSATGPDELGTIVLKRCSKELASPVVSIARLILRYGVWPSGWTVHHIHPLFKKKSKSALRHTPEAPRGPWIRDTST